MEILIDIIIHGLAFFLGARLLKNGIYIKDFLQAIVVAIVVAILNVTLGLALKIVTLGILSIGIFSLLLDAILIQVADYFLKGFKVKNFWWALALAVIVAVIDGVFERLI